MKLWLTGGHQGRPAGAADRGHETLYDRAVLATLDTETGILEEVLRYRSPAEVCGGAPDAVGHTFKAGSTTRDGLWLCTEREALRVHDGDVREHWSHPCLNDVHHVVEVDGRLHLVASGLDAVVVRAGPDVQALSILGDRPTALAVPSEELRGVDRKPHAAHPTHLAVLQGRRWVTRGILGDAVCLDGPGQLSIADVPVHDGVPYDGGLLFTAVDGRLLWGHPDAVRCRLVADLRAGRSEEPPGWCRGVAVVDGIAWVGFTRIRATRLRANLAWVRGRLRGRPVATRRPTRVVGVALDTGTVIAEFPLASVGLDALFSILPAAGFDR